MYIEAPSIGERRLRLLMELNDTPWWAVFRRRRLNKCLDQIDLILAKRSRNLRF